MRRRIRKFAHKQTENNQANRQTENSSKTEATLILCGSSGERANSSKTEATLILCGSSGEQANLPTNKDEAENSSKTEATLSPVVCGSSGNAGQFFISRDKY